MNRNLLAILFTFGSLGVLHAETIDDYHEGPHLSHNPQNLNQPYAFKWWGEPDHYYFVQVSDDLLEWAYFPYAVVGDNGIEGIDFNTNSNHLFLRLYSTDDTKSPPYILDFDQDGICNGDELVAGSPYNVFSAEVVLDTDGDNLPDYWEIYYFGNLSRDGSGDFDNDGIRDAFEWQARTNPKIDQAANYDPETIGLVHYSYDSIGRLVGVNGPVCQNYILDDDGNVKSAE